MSEQLQEKIEMCIVVQDPYIYQSKDKPDVTM